MGTIREVTKKNGDKSFHAEVRLKGFPSVRDSFRTKTQAKQWIQDTEAAIRDGRFKNQQRSRKHTVAEMIDKFVETSIPRHPIYYPKKIQLLVRWKEELGHLLLSELSSASIASVRDRLLIETTTKKSIRSPSTVNRYLAAFSKVLSVAVKEWEWLEENPMLRISKPKEARGRDRFLDHNEIHNLVEACKCSQNANLYPIVLLALFTGMRYGEIVQLKWGDVNFELQSITLQETKNGDRRVIPITEEIVTVLMSIARDGADPTAEVFSSQKKTNSKHLLSIRKPFASALKNAGIDNFRFHDLRHTAASYMAMSGATQGELMAILGHRSPTMTKRYTHYNQQHLRNTLERATNLLFDKSKKKNYAI